MTEISASMLEGVKERFEKLGISLSVPEESVEWIARRGYDDKFGARPLRRTIQHCIEDAAAELMLDGGMKAGDAVIAEVRGEELKLRVEKAPDAEAV